METTGILHLSSHSLAALWTHEITGQLSDGWWEGAKPHDHWKFWVKLTVKVGEKNEVERHYGAVYGVYPKKNKYALEKLLTIECIQERMLKMGRMARALGTHEFHREASENMPETFEEWMRCKEANVWPETWISEGMKDLTPEMASAYYAATYTLRDLKADLKTIKETLKTVLI
jgi:hypothetical protein